MCKVWSSPFNEKHGWSFHVHPLYSCRPGPPRNPGEVEGDYTRDVALRVQDQPVQHGFFPRAFVLVSVLESNHWYVSHKAVMLLGLNLTTAQWACLKELVHGNFQLWFFHLVTIVFCFVAYNHSDLAKFSVSNLFLCCGSLRGGEARYGMTFKSQISWQI